jgi:hypothetical protein
MENYSKDSIKQIKEKILYNQTIIEEANLWIDKNLKNEEKNKISLSIKNSQNTLNKLYNKIDAKPVIAIFGASQVGKSYLIKNLLSKYNSPFVINFKDKEYDFLKEINPPGVGAESTGVVTRFTIDNNLIFEDYPIQVKILSPKDILIILIDSYYSDIKKVNLEYSTKEINTKLNFYESKYKEKKHNIISEYDVLEIKEYFENHLSKNALIFETFKETRLFERIGKIIGGFDYNEWEEIFKIVWNSDNNISNLFNKLIDTISILEFEQNGYIKFEEVLRGGGEILDVKRIKELYSNNKKSNVKLNNDKVKTINTSYLTAIISELIFNIPEELKETKEFLKNSDLLDFPGARSRMALDQTNITEEIIPDMYLRGKVSYLFNKYTDDFNINNLLFCANDKQLDVNEIPSLLENWIFKNIGINSNERSKSLSHNSIPPLFVIFTFFNNQLKFDTTNDIEFVNDFRKLDYKWETRFNRFFENEIVTQIKNWHKDWTINDQNFKNLYLLRDYKYSTDTFNGFEQSGIESEIKQDRIDYLNKLKQSFLLYPFVEDHFRDPKNQWEETTNVNKDGSQIIINNLKEVSNNLTKTIHCINKNNNIINQVKNNLNNYLQTDDVSIVRSRAMKSLNEFQFSFNTIMAKDIESFDQLIQILSINSIEIYNLLNENISFNENVININNIDKINILSNQYPEIKNANNFQEIIEILKDKLWYNNNEEVITFLEKNKIKEEHFFNKKNQKSKSEFYTDLVLEYWINKINKESNYGNLIDYGFDYSLISLISEHYIKIIEVRNIRNKIIYILEEVISNIESNRGIEEFLAEVFTIIINEIVFSLDINYLNDEEIAELKLLNVDVSEIKKSDLVHENDIQILIENIDNKEITIHDLLLKKYNHWFKLLRISLLTNCGFVNFDVIANDELNIIIKKFLTIE